ncbi:MAG TPA: division/cell wall cluster transcriptional repressor MraZ [Bacillota bacterium]|nr:division/cell wall cluster transcriptional repressor MraZ [Bacillota bacterium]HOG53714.1 division/cell wall cluster transcriptional repressor MraZ [Bacillota bacterium]
MFTGKYRHSLDDKNRIIVPSKFRTMLDGRFMATRGLDGCLACYPSDEFTRYIDGLSSLPVEKREVRQYLRMILANAVECEMDSQGRVVIPQELRESAAIKKDVVIIGARNRFEVWAQDVYDKFEQDTSPLLEKLAEGLADMGLKGS